MKVYLAQINTTPGDFEGNYIQIISAIKEGRGADLIVFPELSICGYLVRDLLYLDGFIRKNIEYLTQLAQDTADVKATIVVGYADRSRKEFGKPFKNMAAVLQDGCIIATYQKQLLPFYDVFDEPRYFEPGTELCKIKIAGETCGITICEDLWNDKGQDDYNYNNNPVQCYRDAGVKTIINLSSSPYYVGKVMQRAKMAREITVDEMSLVYVNQIGGQDELVFDGHSMVAFDGHITQLGGGMADTKSRASDDIKGLDYGYYHATELVDQLIIGLKDYVHKTGHKEVVINSSGGVDSAVVIALAAKAFGGSNVHCIMMPSKYSSEGSLADAKELHAKFGCHEYVVPIDHDPIINALPYAEEPAPVAEENVQARMRGLMGAIYFSNAYGALPLTTGNKTELALGYCTLYGDMSGGFNPIGDLYKDQVMMVGDFLGVPDQILYKAPSAELRPDQTDEASLLPYRWLNLIVRAFIEDYISDYDAWIEWVVRSGSPTMNALFLVNPSVKRVIKQLNKKEYMVKKEDYDRIVRLIKINEFKRRQAAPCIKVSKIAFGMGRRMPIVSKF